LSKKKSGKKGEEADVASPTSETRPGGAAALALSGKADELVAKGGILAYLNTWQSQSQPTTVMKLAGLAEDNAKGGAAAAAPEKPKISSPKEPAVVSVVAAAPAEVVVKGQSGSAVQNFKEQFQERIDRNGGRLGGTFPPPPPVSPSPRLFAVKTPVDDSQYGPCIQYETRERQPSHQLMMTGSTAHVTNLTPPGSANPSVM
jgi:hypothetical protein